MSAGQPHELPRLADDHALPGSSAGHSNRAAPAEPQQALIPQLPKSTQHRVGVHPEHRREILSRRKPLALASLAYGAGRFR